MRETLVVLAVEIGVEIEARSSVTRYSFVGY
jgi:hypothetical protein